MLRVVYDTNVVISGRLWTGTPFHALRAADEGRVAAFISEPMVDELRDVLQRPKFLHRLQLLGKTAEAVILEHLHSVEVVNPAPIEPVITVDPDDDAVLACALAAHADIIVTGDPHLLECRTFKGIPIVAPAEFVARLTSTESPE